MHIKWSKSKREIFFLMFVIAGEKGVFFLMHPIAIVHAYDSPNKANTYLLRLMAGGSWFNKCTSLLGVVTSMSKMQFKENKIFRCSLTDSHIMESIKCTRTYQIFWQISDQISS